MHVSSEAVSKLKGRGWGGGVPCAGACSAFGVASLMAQ